MKVKFNVRKNGGRILGGLVLVALVSGCGSENADVAAFDEVDLSADADVSMTANAGSAEVAAGRDLDEVVVRVEGEDITRGELMREVDMLMGRMRGQVPPQQMAAMREEIVQGAIENLITRRLLLGRVKAEQIEVDDTEIDEVIAMFHQQLPPGANFEDQLAETGMTMADLRDNLRQELVVNRMLEQKVVDLQEPSEADIVAFYELHMDDYFTLPETAEASHILINTQGKSDEEVAAARQQLEEIREELLQGADFAVVAETHSACPSSAQGGSLGRFPRGQMVPAFEEAAFSQEIGEIGEIVETQFGFHVVMVTDRHEAGVQSLDENREQIASHLSRQERDIAVRAYIQNLREAADVEFLESL